MQNPNTSPRRGLSITAIAVLLVLVISGVAYALYDRTRNTSEPVQTVLSQATPPSSSPATAPPSDQTPPQAPCPQGRPAHLLNLGGEEVRVCGKPINGSVTASSDSSLTVATEDGNAHTFSLNGDTIITEQGRSATASDIRPGDRVSVLPADADASLAGRILLNPRLGRG